MDRKTVLAIMLTLLLLSMLTFAFNIQPANASGTIYIKADGSVEGTTDISSVDNITYTLTDNIYDEIVVERDNIVVDGAGFTVQGTGAWGSKGIDLPGRTNVTIKNVEVTNFRYGIWLQLSSNNVLADNTVHSNNWAGVQLSLSSNHNNASGNSITNNNQDGIAFYSSSFNIVSGNNIANHNRDGIAFYSSSNNNTVSKNNITNSNRGVRFDLSSFNTVSGNYLTNNSYGVFLWSSSHKIYHNNFINNTNQAGTFEPNTWDNGYPSGGNYWSDHVTIDNHSGINQDEPGSDGIVDEPYIIDENNCDNYPLVEPWSPVISATVDVDPDTLNLGSKGKWITAYIQLPEEHNAEEIDAATILLNETISPVLDPKCEFVTNSSEYLADYDEDGILERMVKFDKAEVMTLLSVGEATLTITGKVKGTSFEGSDSVKVR